MASARIRWWRGVALRGLYGLLAGLPLRAVHALGALAGGLAGWLGGRSARVVRTNLDLCFPDLASASRGRLARRVFREAGKAAFEAGPLWLWPVARVNGLVRAVAGGAALDAAVAQGRGVVIALPHFGCWEVVGLWLSQRYPVTSLYRPPALAALEPLMTRGRERAGNRLVPTGAGGVRALYQALRTGEMVIILPDQVPQPGSGVVAPFFGVAAETAVLALRLAARNGSPVVLAGARRRTRGAGYDLEFQALDLPLDDAPRAAAQLNAAIETLVRSAPEQYQWAYKRFRHRERPGPDPYRHG